MAPLGVPEPAFFYGCERIPETVSIELWPAGAPTPSPLSLSHLQQMKQYFSVSLTKDKWPEIQLYLRAFRGLRWCFIPLLRIAHRQTNAKEYPKIADV